MKKPVKTLFINEGVVYASSEEFPKQLKGHYYTPKTLDRVNKIRLGQFKALEVENKITFFVELAVFICKGGIVSPELASCKDGEYEPPNGLMIEEKRICPNVDTFCEVCTCDESNTAILSFEETELPNELELESNNGSRITIGCPDDNLHLYMTMRKRNYYGYRYSDYTLSLDEADKLAKFLTAHVKREHELNRRPEYLS